MRGSGLVRDVSETDLKVWIAEQKRENLGLLLRTQYGQQTGRRRYLPDQGFSSAAVRSQAPADPQEASQSVRTGSGAFREPAARRAPRPGIVLAASESRIVSAHGIASSANAAPTRNATRYAVRFATA